MEPWTSYSYLGRIDAFVVCRGMHVQVSDMHSQHLKEIDSAFSTPVLNAQLRVLRISPLPSRQVAV